MKDSVHHALLACSQLEIDIARISASGNEAQQGLAADCAEHRRQLANKLRHIEHLSQIEPEDPYGSVFGISRNPTVMSELIAQTNSAESRDRYEASAKAGDFNDINEPDDDTHLRHAAVSDAKALAEYQRKVSRIGWYMAAIAAGVILGGIKIWFTYF